MIQAQRLPTEAASHSALPRPAPERPTEQVARGPGAMRAVIGTYQAADGYRLHYRHWLPQQPQPLCRIVALHGIQSHSGWYEYSSRRLCEAGCELFFLDRRGSGMNEADRGHAESSELLIDDVVRCLSQARERGGSDQHRVPVVLLAVSWGGKLAVHVAARRPDLVDGLALLYPGLRARVRATWWQNSQLTLAARLGIRQKKVPVPLSDPALFTNDRQWQTFIRHDPLALHEVTVSFLLANRRLDRGIATCGANIRCPVLLLLAGQDRIIDNRATRQCVAAFASPETSIRQYPLAAHTLEFERDRDVFIDDLSSWIGRTAARPAKF